MFNAFDIHDIQYQEALTRLWILIQVVGISSYLYLEARLILIFPEKGRADIFTCISAWQVIQWKIVSDAISEMCYHP